MQQARQLGRYQLLDRVAFGGMAEIYRAKTADAEGRLHLVAVKRVLGHLCEDDEFIQMLVDEAKITASLQHENIARIYEFCRTEREYFIAMEYVDGKDVRALLEKARQSQEPLPEEHVARIGMEIGRALHAAHTQRDKDGRPLRIVHRDVSPSNVLLSYRGEVKLCDFGIAKATLTRVQTKTGVIKGKVKYMSPEQAMGRKLDHRSDLFSLGTLLYEMLTLTAPFQAPTEIELIFAVRDARKRPAHELRPGLNPVLEEIVDRAMARSRSQRYQSGEELAQALEAYLAEFFPGSRRSQFGRFMRNVFAKEIDRELRMLEEYVIEGGKADDVGENLLADVLGPNAPYTQFTAAFIDGAGGLLDLPTGQKGEAEALPDDDLGEERTGPQKRAQGAPVPIVDPALLPRQVMPMAGKNLRSEIDAGWGVAIAPPLPPPPAAQAESLDPSFHDEETRILTRAQVNASLSGLHEAATRIFDLRNLPRNMQEALQPQLRSQEALQDLPTLAPVSPAINEMPTVALGRSERAAAWQEEETRPPAGLTQEPHSSPTADPPLHTGAGPSSFNNQPTRLKEPGPLRTGSIELSAEELSFIDAPLRRPADEPEPSVILDESDLETLD